MEIMIPVWLDEAAPQIAKTELGELRGATVAIVDDNFDEAFTSRIEELLVRSYGAVVDRLIKPLGSAPSPKSLIEQAARSQVAVVGIAL